MRNVPAIGWVCITVAFLGVITGAVVLAVTGADGAEYRGLLNIVANLAMMVLGGGSVVLAGQARNQAEQAAEQTNGGMERRIAAAVNKALDDRGLA